MILEGKDVVHKKKSQKPMSLNNGTGENILKRVKKY
jgi:hypothetical protein